MRLRRFTPSPKAPLPAYALLSDYSTSGHWFSADRCWSFHRGPLGWHIYACSGHDPIPFVGTDMRSVRFEQLCQAGLIGTYFKTRRQAIAALELMLEGVSA